MFISTLRNIAFVAVCASLASASFADPVQWTIAEGGNGHSYEVITVDNGILWDDARLAAEAAGGYLAVVTSSSENDFIYGVVSTIATAWDGSGIHTLGPWLGGYQDLDNSDAWTWITGEDFGYENWGSSQPTGNGDFLNIYGYRDSIGAYWNDYSDVCPSYVIEYVPEPTTMSLLTLGAVVAISRRKRS